jgi:hypothetical protein
MLHIITSSNQRGKQNMKTIIGQKTLYSWNVTVETFTLELIESIATPKRFVMSFSLILEVCNVLIHLRLDSNITGAVKQVYYPKCNPSRKFYDACRTENGGYGGLLSVSFHVVADAMKFYDSINVAKGPSLGTNFTLWYGIASYIVRWRSYSDTVLVLLT